MKVKLANGKELTIQHMIRTTFWHPDGTPMSAAEFLKIPFGELPEFFKDESELRALWSSPVTRKMLLIGFGGEGFWSPSTGRNADDHRRGEERHLRCARIRGLPDASAELSGKGCTGEGRDHIAIHQQAASVS